MENDISFEAQKSEDDDAQIMKYEFVVDDEGVPKKLGDGTFGSVFEAKGPGNQRCAVKLFYPVSKGPEGQISKRRNKSEMHSGINVASKLDESNQIGLISNLVLSEAWTDKFRKSKAFEFLKGEFSKLGVAVSNDALVMPYYECTLKDVLEIGAPEGRLVKGEIEENQGRPGYEILRNLTVAERERHIIGIVSQIVTGLRALHAAGLYHHDIKPANVMMKSNAFNVDVALGDFGFLETNVRLGRAGYAAGLPLGTRHYRSPEQKDFFDVCDVKVSLDKDKKTLILETDDRKFHDTLIEVGDIAEFSKDENKIGYPVVQVEHPSEGESNNFLNPTKVVLQSMRENEPEDQKTQVMFYKKPSPRTDIFGVGAILFDLLTVGRSSECFYDYLRPFDRTERDEPVSLIVEKYRAATSANSTSAELASLFEQVRDDIQTRYPSPEIISVLLRCMLSRAPDSYYQRACNEKGEVDRRKLFSAVQDDLTELTNNEAISTMSGTNPIWAGKESSFGTTGTTPDSFLTSLEELQTMDIGKRMVWGTYRFRQLVQMIDNNINQGVFFDDLSPGNLRLNNTNVVPVVESYKSEEGYLRAVRSGSAWRMDAMGETDNYVPVYRRFNMRLIEVEKAEESSAEKAEESSAEGAEESSAEGAEESSAEGAEESSAEGAEESSAEGAEESSAEGVMNLKARYVESLPIWRGNRKGDLLRVVDHRGRPRLCEIVKINPAGVWKGMKIEEVTLPNKGATVMPSDQENTRPSDEDIIAELIQMGRTRGIVIRRLIPMNYYLSILATYIHHLFFVDGECDDGTIPDVVWSGLLQSNIKGGLFTTKKEENAPLKKAGVFFDSIFGSAHEKETDKLSLRDLRSLLAKIYLDFLFTAEKHDTKDSRDAMKMRSQMLDLSDELDDAVAKLCGYKDRNELRAVSITEINKNLPKVSSDDDNRTFSECLRDYLP